MAKFHQRKSALSRKMRIGQSTCNFRSFSLRLFLLFLVLLLLLGLLFWLLFHPNWLLLSSPPPNAGFSIEFSNVRREYSIRPGPIDPCRGRPIKLLVLVMSRRESEEKRRGIRESWAKDAPEGIVIRFVIGQGATRAGEEEGGQEGVELALEGEQRRFRDLVRYSLEDGYANLHFKMAAAFQFQMSFCPQAQFVMKTDDDTIVDLERWWFWTEKKFKKDLERNGAAFFGYVLENTSPIRQKEHKWFVPAEHFPGSVYPRYMQGATYFGTAQAVRAVMAHTREVVGFNMDDLVYTGSLAERANVSRFDYKFEHFRGGSKLMPDEPCEEGIPKVFARFEAFTRAEEFRKAYEELRSVKCK